MILVTNCPHDNGVYTFIDTLSGLVTKSSYAEEGIKRLEREHAGYEWYLRRAELDTPCRLELRHWRGGSYARLVVSQFPGKTGDSYRGLSQNRQRLLAAVALYSTIWPRVPGRLAPIHGDFDVGNIVTGSHGCVIIDWEHFHVDAAPWGLDLLNLLYGSTALSLRRRTPLTASDKDVFAQVREAIARVIDPRDGLDCSLRTLTEFIASHSAIWGGLVNKLPVMNLSPEQRAYVTGLEAAE